MGRMEKAGGSQQWGLTCLSDWYWLDVLTTLTYCCFLQIALLMTVPSPGCANYPDNDSSRCTEFLGLLRARQEVRES